MTIYLRVLFVFAALIAASAAAYIGLMPVDAPACGTGLRPEGMCFWTTPEERRPEALAWLAGSVGLVLAAFLIGRYRWTGRDL